MKRHWKVVYEVSFIGVVEPATGMATVYAKDAIEAITKITYSIPQAVVKGVREV